MSPPAECRMSGDHCWLLSLYQSKLLITVPDIISSAANTGGVWQDKSRLLKRTSKSKIPPNLCHKISRSASIFFCSNRYG